MEYFRKMMGTTKSPPAVSLFEILWSWIGAFLGISSVALVHYNVLGEGADMVMVIGSEKIHALGYLYAAMPVALGAVMMLIVALLVNNIPKNRRYPEFWF